MCFYRKCFRRKSSWIFLTWKFSMFQCQPTDCLLVVLWSGQLHEREGLYIKLDQDTKQICGENTCKYLIELFVPDSKTLCRGKTQSTHELARTRFRTGSNSDYFSCSNNATKIKVVPLFSQLSRFHSFYLRERINLSSFARIFFPTLCFSTNETMARSSYNKAKESSPAKEQKRREREKRTLKVGLNFQTNVAYRPPQGHF